MYHSVLTPGRFGLTLKAQIQILKQKCGYELGIFRRVFTSSSKEVLLSKETPSHKDTKSLPQLNNGWLGWELEVVPLLLYVL